MGIKDLNKFITTFCPKAIKKLPISHYSGKKIAVDVSIFLYKFIYSNKLIDSFYQQYYHFIKENIELIYVFDGKPPEEKEYVLNSRKNTKEKQINKIEEMEKALELIPAENTIEIKRAKMKLNEAKRKCIIVTQEDINNVKLLFDKIGAKYIHEECEADLICCDLYKKGLVSGCLSNDMDFLPSGCGILLRNYNLGNMIDEYNLDIILSESELSYEKFVDFCILCGCDYTCKIPRLGFITAFKSLKLYENIEGIIEELCVKQQKFKLPDNFNYDIARKLLKNEQQKNQNFKLHNLEFKAEPENEIIKFLKSHTKYSDIQLINRLKIILSNNK